MNTIFDIDELAKYIKEHNVDGIIGFCIDPTQRPAQQIAEKVGLPAFGTWEQVLALTDKTIFKNSVQNLVLIQSCPIQKRILKKNT